MVQSNNSFQELVTKAKQIGIVIDNAKPVTFLKNIPFWCSNYIDPNDKTRVIQDGETCCYNHWLGLPQRWNKRHPMYEYEINFVQALAKHKKIHCEKAAGLGITELVLRWLEWSALTNPEFENSQVVIISGPNRSLAKKLIARMVGLKEENAEYHDLGSRGIASDITDYTFRINTTHFEAAPSDNIDSVRSLPNPKAFFADESAFFMMMASKEIQIRQAIEHYDLKSNPWLIWVSTPGYIPEGVFYTIKTEEPSQYKKIPLSYEVGLEVNPQSMTSIYPREALEEAKKSPSFAREYQLVWGGGQGNIFHWKLVDEITADYDVAIGQGPKGLYVDPAYGSSKFAILGLELIDGIIYVKEALQFDRPSPAVMINIIVEKAAYYNNRVKVDSAHPGVITDLKLRNINAIPVSFNKELSAMTIKAAQAVKDKKVRIKSIFYDLISQLKAVDFNEKGHPDKKKLTFDLGDTFLMGIDDLLSYSSGHVLGGIPEDDRHASLTSNSLLDKNYTPGRGLEQNYEL